MLFTLGHGQHVIQDSDARGLAPQQERPDAVPLAKVTETAPASRSLAADTQARGGLSLSPQDAPGAFRYFFREAAGVPEAAGVVEALDALANSMVEPDGDPENDPQGHPVNSRIAPVFTYFGQFIDHDITANTDRKAPISAIDGDCAPQPRNEVERQLDNLRDGSLRLDSLYGDSPGQGAFAIKLAKLMRHPILRNKMRLGIATDTGNRPPLPQDPAADLLRLGHLVERGELTEAELNALDPALRNVFFRNGELIKAHAIIGDDRNDENLIVAQLHVAFLRLHNRLVDASGGDFETARRLTRFHYQWLTVNAYLPAVCDPAVVARVVQHGAPLYSDFFARNRPANGAKMPMPLEFSVAGFRFGHSMVRGAYDHNRIFGTAVAGTQQFLPVAGFELLFRFTGGGGMRPSDDAPIGEALPDNWIIEWDRFVANEPGPRAARKIDTRLAPPLKDMFKEAAGVFRHLARRNLRRGYRLNLPTAQGCLEAINAAACYDRTEPLDPAVIRAGREFMADSGLDENTPLWFYILREAEEAGGDHLGPLGSLIIAETLVGLLVNDPDSYWHEKGEGGQRWTPRPEIDGMEGMLRFIGMIA